MSKWKGRSFFCRSWSAGNAGLVLWSSCLALNLLAPLHRWHCRDVAWATLPTSDQHTKALAINSVHHRTQHQVGAGGSQGGAAGKHALGCGMLLPLAGY